MPARSNRTRSNRPSRSGSAGRTTPKGTRPAGATASTTEVAARPGLDTRARPAHADHLARGAGFRPAPSRARTRGNR
jgi:hypothetical protein